MKQMLQQLLHGQTSGSMEMAKKISELHNKLDCSYNDLNVKVETLNTKVRYLEGHSASSSAPKQISQLSGKAIQNPNEYAHGITLGSGKALPTREEPKTVTKDSEIKMGRILVSVKIELTNHSSDHSSNHSSSHSTNNSSCHSTTLLYQLLDLPSQRHHQLLQNQLLSRRKKRSMSLLLTNHNFHFLAVTKKHWQISIELYLPRTSKRLSCGYLLLTL